MVAISKQSTRKRAPTIVVAVLVLLVGFMTLNVLVGPSPQEYFIVAGSEVNPPIEKVNIVSENSIQKKGEEKFAAENLVETKEDDPKDMRKDQVALTEAQPNGKPQLRIFHKAQPHSKGQSGRVIHDQLLCHAYAWHQNAVYGGACGNAEYDEHEALLNSIGLHDELPFKCAGDFERDGKFINSKVPRETYHKDDTRIWIPEYIDFLKSKVKYPSKEPNKFTIVVHIKRGEKCTPCKAPREGYQQYMPNSHYQRLIDKYMRPDARVAIFSQEDSYESFDEFEEKGYELHLDHPMEEVWQTIVTADVIILSRSSFGLLPSLVTKGTVVYTPFWHKPLRGWHTVRDKEILGALERDTAALKGKCPPTK